MKRKNRGFILLNNYFFNKQQNQEINKYLPPLISLSLSLSRPLCSCKTSKHKSSLMPSSQLMSWLVLNTRKIRNSTILSHSLRSVVTTKSMLFLFIGMNSISVESKSTIRSEKILLVTFLMLVIWISLIIVFQILISC